MNHRTGRLTWRDFDHSQQQPAPQFFADAIETDSDFGVVNPGRTFKQPPPDRDMWQMERDNPWIWRLYAACFIAGILLTCAATRCSS